MSVASRALLALGLLAASVSWSAFVLTNTVGDPGRGERIAGAILDDPDARAEVVAPIADAVMAAFPIPAREEPFVERSVEQVLLDPSGAAAFIDPFAGSWARLLGEDDPRPAEVDLRRLLGVVDELVAPIADAPDLSLDDAIAIPSVPLPRARLDWMRDVRDTASAAVVPLALLAAALVGAAMLTGDPRRVTRRAGLWGITAGLLWIALPPLLVWIARRWAPGADAVVSVSLDTATDGLRLPAFALAASGAIAIVVSTIPCPSRSDPAPLPVTEHRFDDAPRSDGAHAGERFVPTTTLAAVAAGDTPPRGAAASPDVGAPDEEPVDSVWDYYSR